MKYQNNPSEPSFTVANIDFIHVCRPRGFKHSYRSGRVKNGLLYILKGEMRYSFLSNGEVMTLKEGELLFIPKGCAYHAVYLEEETALKIIQFETASGNLPYYLQAPCLIDLPEARETVEGFFPERRDNVPSHPFYYLSLLYRLLWQIDALYTHLPAKYKRLGVALDEISVRFDQNKSVAYYASLCDMSEVSFRRLFREYTGQSPIDYRNDLRLTHAQKRLSGGEYNVTEAAESVGFSNLSFFIRLYKKKFGYTPKKE